ncbi:MAG: acetylxylan esterase [Acidobacteriota bacterium]|nr:acetylxylan esterase [Acidobacteriota bacterium]
MKRFLSLVLLAAPVLAQDPFLKWMDAIAQGQLAHRDQVIAGIADTRAAEARKTAVRAKILELLGGLPTYDGPLNARVTGKIEQPGYTIEKIIFESLPGIVVTANLYRPNAPGRYPGVLMPMGHWEEGKPAGQRIAANLAHKGFVVLAYDPLGQGERQQAYDARLHASLVGGSTEQHILAGGQSILTGEAFARFRIWDAKRALDYLVSRPEVDRENIGCTGCSGGGTITTYISALDPRIKVAAPACYINTFHLLFSGPTGDSEQSLPFFLSSGLDIPDYIELFAPKPWLILNTADDFFPLAGAKQAYEEALRWYKIYGAEEKIRWVVGPGGHGTPLEVREAIYEWMIRWLKNGQGDAKEEQIEMLPNHMLLATEAGQVDGREIYQAIHDDFEARKSPGTRQQLLAELRKWSGVPGKAPAIRADIEQLSHGVRVQKMALQVEPDLEISATLHVPDGAKRKPAVVLVGAPAAMADQIAALGAVVLALDPRGSATPSSRLFSGDWITNTRALLIGRDLAGMRSGDIMSGVSLLAERADVDPAKIHAAGRGTAGVWLLMAAALDKRIASLWLDRTPYSVRAALETSVHRNLHDAVIPGFALHWDLADIVKAIEPRRVLWTDPVDWNGTVIPQQAGFVYRTFEDANDRYLRQLLN